MQVARRKGGAGSRGDKSISYMHSLAFGASLEDLATQWVGVLP